MALLARREHSQTELFRKLLAKNFPDQEIRTQLDALIQEGTINHSRFIENYIHFRRSKGFGPLRIRQELKEKGLGEEFIAEHLDLMDNAWHLELHKIWQKRFKGKVPQDFKSRTKQIRFFQYRGFTQDQISQVMPDL